MDIVVVETLAEPVGTKWRELQEETTAAGQEFFVAAPLSSTPLPIFKWIIDNAASFPAWHQVRFVLMDEQLEGESEPFEYVDVNDSASYEGFARRHLITPLREVIGIEIPVMRPNLDTLNSFSVDLDLLLLAIGPHGNYANVMPGTPVETGWHVAHLEPEFRRAHTSTDSGSYAGATFREYGMSLGPQQVLSARETIVIASGPKKSQLVAHLCELQQFDTQSPISIIHDPRAAQKTSIVVTPDVIQARGT